MKKKEWKNIGKERIKNGNKRWEGKRKICNIVLAYEQEKWRKTIK